MRELLEKNSGILRRIRDILEENSGILRRIREILEENSGILRFPAEFAFLLLFYSGSLRDSPFYCSFMVFSA